MPVKSINFTSTEPQYIADLGDIARNYSDNDPGKKYIVSRPVYYNSFGAKHLTDDEHKIRLEWLHENQEGLWNAIENPKFTEKKIRERLDGHYSLTQIVELAKPKDERKYMAVAISLSKELDNNQAYHQITTIHPMKYRDLFTSTGELKNKYMVVK